MTVSLFYYSISSVESVPIFSRLRSMTLSWPQRFNNDSPPFFTAADQVSHIKLITWEAMNGAGEPVGGGDDQNWPLAVPLKPLAIRPQAFCTPTARISQAAVPQQPVVSLVHPVAYPEQLAHCAQLVQMIPQGDQGNQPLGVHIMWPSQQVTEQLVSRASCCFTALQNSDAQSLENVVRLIVESMRTGCPLCLPQILLNLHKRPGNVCLACAMFLPSSSSHPPRSEGRFRALRHRKHAGGNLGREEVEELVCIH
jgi:hypothetical protein